MFQMCEMLFVNHAVQLQVVFRFPVSVESVDMSSVCSM
jgi:hypothetical protein